MTDPRPVPSRRLLPLPQQLPVSPLPLRLLLPVNLLRLQLPSLARQALLLESPRTPMERAQSSQPGKPCTALPTRGVQQRQQSRLLWPLPLHPRALSLKALLQRLQARALPPQRVTLPVLLLP